MTRRAALKIAFISNIFPPQTRGGYELGCRDIARAFAAKGHDVNVLTSLAVGKQRTSSPVTDLRVHPIFEPIFAFDADLVAPLAESATWCQARTDVFGGVHYANALALGRWLQANRPDVVWIFNTIGLGPVSIYEAALSTSARVLALLMDDIDVYVMQTRRHLSWTPRFRRLKSRIDAISCSQLTQQHNRKIGDYRRHAVIHNGIPFPASAPRSATKRGMFSFCYFGQIEEPKGVLQILDAARTVRERRPELRFDVHLYGTGSQRFHDRVVGELRRTAQTENVILHGFVEKRDLLKRLRQHDAALMLLRDGEPFAYAPIEAIAAGLPVLLSRHGGNSECISPDYPLFIDNRHDAGAVADKMAWCIDHRERLPKVFAHLYDEVQRHCDFESVTIPAYERFLRRVPANDQTTSIASLLASTRTIDFYEQAEYTR